MDFYLLQTNNMINKSIAKNLLKNKKFKKLFIEELGWDEAATRAENENLTDIYRTF